MMGEELPPLRTFELNFRQLCVGYACDQDVLHDGVPFTVKSEPTMVSSIGKGRGASRPWFSNIRRLGTDLMHQWQGLSCGPWSVSDGDRRDGS